MRVVSWLAVIACAFASGCYDRDVTGQEIRELLGDSQVRGRHLRDNYSFVRNYHADGTFEQIEGPPGSGHWRVAGNQICVDWDPPYPKGGDLCRRMKTDDDGLYWKEFDNAKNKTIRVVEYTSFTGADGRDLRRIPSASEYRRRWLSTWRGWTLGLIALVVVILLIRRFVKTKHVPDSLRNRVRRGLFGIKAGDHAYSWGALFELGSAKLGDLIGACVVDSKWVEIAWAAEALFRPGMPRGEAIAALWRGIQPFDDETAERAIVAAIKHLDETKLNIDATEGNLRFAYLVGKAHASIASDASTKNELTFGIHKDLALKHFEHVRTRQPVPPTVSELSAHPFRPSPAPPTDDAGYARLVGPAYEAMMYMTFVAPQKSSRSSSSYSGGG